MTDREESYRTLIEPLTVQEVAREMGVTVDFVLQQIKDGKLLALPDGRTTGSELSRYFAAHRRD